MKVASICVIVAAFFWLVGGNAHADEMKSVQYRIDFGNVNIGSNQETSSNYKLGTTLGQLAANQFSSSGYVVKAGFQYVHSIIPFAFSISDISIALGTLTANTPATATTDLTVSFGGAGAYQVTAEEIGPLDTPSGSDVIIDTSCNGGGQTCTETTANVWDSASAYGFGYNMSGTGAPAGFTNATYFKRFPDALLAETPEVVMSSSNVTASSTSTVTFKANISPVQAAGSYRTLIRFIATPSF
ncbi:hypothetical protein KBC70_01660 [Candidatus Woesebacteria bacterium]|nr:hypothetical protein [Candidatus Woesebacteria bacterium]